MPNMGFEWIQWLGHIIKVIGDLVPQRILIEPTHRGVKFKGMTKTVVLVPGRYWYIPFFTSHYIIPVVKQSLYCPEQDLTTLDGKPVKIRCVVSYNVENVKKALVECYEFSEQIDDETMGLICRYVAKKNLQDLMDNMLKFNAEVTILIRRRMREYGIHVNRVQITSFISGTSLLHTGLIVNVEGQ
jgi:regulator of protease activity HflC (stomatin/prohibitin superfamily)